MAELETALKIEPKYMPALYHLGRIASQRTFLRNLNTPSVADRTNLCQDRNYSVGD